MTARIPAVVAFLMLLPSGLLAQEPLATADSAWARGDHQEAFRIYSGLYQQESLPPLALHRMALVHIWNERLEEGVELLDETVSEHPEYAPALLDRGLLHGRAGRFDEAVRDLERYTEGDPDHLAAQEALARYASWAGRHQASLAAYERALEMDPERNDLRLARARVLSWDGRLEASLEAYQELVERSPEDMEARAGLAQVLSWTGRYDQARAAYERVLEEDPENQIARMGLAQVATWGGELREGERRWRVALLRVPDDPDLLMGLAANLRMQERERAAARVLRRLEAEDPGRADVEEERARLTAATAPRLHPSTGYARDSDQNRILTVGLTTRWKASDPVELAVTATRRDLAWRPRPDLDQTIHAVDVVATLRARSGWGVRAGVGAWHPGAADASTRPTARAGVSMPPWLPARADLMLSRTIFDVTSLVADVQVRLTELRLDGSVRTGSRSSLQGTLSTARLRGSESNARHLSAARYTHRIRPWVAMGPAFRAFTFDRVVDDGYWNPDSYLILEIPVTLGPTEGDWIPRLEAAAGYQRSDEGGDDPWSPAFRAEAGITRNLDRGRRIGFSAVYADSGAQRLSGGEGEGYRYRGVNLFAVWPL